MRPQSENERERSENKATRFEVVSLLDTSDNSRRRAGAQMRLLRLLCCLVNGVKRGAGLARSYTTFFFLLFLLSPFCYSLSHHFCLHVRRRFCSVPSIIECGNELKQRQPSAWLMRHNETSSLLFFEQQTLFLFFSRFLGGTRLSLSLPVTPFAPFVSCVVFILRIMVDATVV